MVDTHPPRVSRQDRDLPPLQNGDRLSRPEFERRYTAMPDLKKAELIEGIVYMASPLRFAPHAEPHADVIIWLGTYKVATPGVRLGDNATVRLDRDNEPQPDALLLIDPTCGGQAFIGTEGYVEGAPEFVAEIAASSTAIDLGDKQRVYRRNRVQEYWVWQVFEQKIDWYHLADEEYVSLAMNPEGVIASRIFPGLWLDVAALLAGDMPQVLAVLHQGLASVEHQQFVRQLAQAAG